LAEVDEWLDAVGFDFFFGVDSKLFRNFSFDRQSMCVPAGFTLAVVASHRFVAREQIFDRAGQAMPRMRFAVCGRRAFEKDKFLLPVALSE